MSIPSITPVLQTITKGTALEGMYGEAPPPKPTVPDPLPPYVPVQWLFTVHGYGQNGRGQTVKIYDTCIEATDEDDAKRVFVAKHARTQDNPSGYRDLHIVYVDQYVDEDNWTKQRDQYEGRIRSLKERLAATQEVQTPFIEWEEDGGRHGDPQEAVTVAASEDVAKRAVLWLCEKYRADLAAYAAEITHDRERDA